MKKLSTIAMATLMLVAFISCEDESNTEKGEKAAVEFCDCLETNTKSECEDELRDEYTKAEYTSSDFIAAFNKIAEASCGVTMTLYSY